MLRARARARAIILKLAGKFNALTCRRRRHLTLRLLYVVVVQRYCDKQWRRRPCCARARAVILHDNWRAPIVRRCGARFVARSARAMAAACVRQPRCRTLCASYTAFARRNLTECQYPSMGVCLRACFCAPDISARARARAPWRCKSLRAAPVASGERENVIVAFEAR